MVLDTYVYNGHGTTGSTHTAHNPSLRNQLPLPADALWAGVPVITLPGQHMAARVASTLVSLHLRSASDVIKSLFVVRNFEECARCSI